MLGQACLLWTSCLHQLPVGANSLNKHCGLGLETNGPMDESISCSISYIVSFTSGLV